MYSYKFFEDYTANPVDVKRKLVRTITPPADVRKAIIDRYFMAGIGEPQLEYIIDTHVYPFEVTSDIIHFGCWMNPTIPLNMDKVIKHVLRLFVTKKEYPPIFWQDPYIPFCYNIIVKVDG
jgi:hypothetical protein